MINHEILEIHEKGRKTEVGGQMSEVSVERGVNSEGGERGAKAGKQKAENRKQKTVGGWREARGRRAEVGGRQSEGHAVTGAATKYSGS